MKSYTDLEQSKKLAEILPLESADMCYRIVAYNPNDTHEYQPYCFFGTLSSDIPCWSLAALLNIIPYPTLTQEENKQWVACSYPPNHLGCVSKFYNNPIDACVAMIEKLHEQKLI